MFAEDIGLLPQDIFTHLLDECRLRLLLRPYWLTQCHKRKGGEPVIALASARTIAFDACVKPGRVLLEMGAEQCSDAQLLAILLGSGGRGYSAVDSANALLNKYGTLARGLMKPSLGRNRADQGH